MPKTELIFTDEEINRLAERIAYKISNEAYPELMNYGIIAKYKKCTVYLEMDEHGNDMIIIRDKNDNIIGKFEEVDI